MRRTILHRSGLLVATPLAISGRAFAQHSHAHSDSAAATAHDMAGMEMSGDKDDWKMAAMARHMAYSSVRPLTAADSARSAGVINELRQAIAKYQDVKVAEPDRYNML